MNLLRKYWSVVFYLLLILMLFFTVGCSSTTFKVSSVKFTAPNWADEPGIQSSAVAHITFNRNCAGPTAMMNMPMEFDLKGLSSGRIATNIEGTLKWNEANEVVFISDESLADLINPEAGENTEWTIRIDGTQPGACTDSQGELLDGDSDGNPGGDYLKTFEIVG